MRLALAGLLIAGAALAVPAGAGATGAAAQPFTLRSPDFRDGAPLPTVHAYRGYGCTGKNLAPTLLWSGVPAGTRSFALVMVDPDAPKPGGWTHWLAYNLPASWRALRPSSPRRFEEGTNDFGATGYGGPCPPPDGHLHHYIFTLYALAVARLPGHRLAREALLRDEGPCSGHGPPGWHIPARVAVQAVRVR